MVVNIGGVDRINTSTLRVDLVDVHGRPLREDVRLQHVQGTEVLQTKLVPPKYPFKVKLKGRGFYYDDVHIPLPN